MIVGAGSLASSTCSSVALADTASIGVRGRACSCLPRADGAHGGKAAHDRHLQVHQHEIEAAGRELLDRFLAVLREGDLQATTAPAAAPPRGGSSGCLRRPAGGGSRSSSRCRNPRPPQPSWRPARRCGRARSAQHLERRALAFLGLRLTWPLISSTRRFTMERPRPRPPNLREVEMSGLLEALEDALGQLPARSRTPVSVTDRRSCVLPSASSSTSADTLMWPSSVNLTALLSRLPSTWPIRTGSPAEDAIAACGNERIEAQALGLRARARRLAGVAQRLFELERTHVELDVVALEAREFDEIVHHAQQRAARCRDQAHHLAPAARRAACAGALRRPPARR